MTVFGLIAGALTMLSFLPQVLRTARTRSAGDLSWGWLLLFGGGVAMWAVYGLATGDVPVAATNVITLGLVSVLVVLKVRTREVEA
ncbi:SemiSWEET family sugar transporter [Allokutzneria sp. NRRL B-24872]|uniref:SemiSWEET family sugar transporter n=1 Tax=Allokutzneria sp. NRRL B-24872 TaxID=1137961 RepID=UPI001AF0236F|nr:SemiSWEET transporter [Allokutzneria sp. NRRL B-24872]